MINKVPSIHNLPEFILYRAVGTQSPKKLSLDCKRKIKHLEGSDTEET